MNPGVIVISLALLLLSGCSTVSMDNDAPAVEVTVGNGVDLSDSPAVKERLYQQFSLWKGTPYDLGGLSRSGVDCSGFVYVTYRDSLGWRLPRTTELQASVGREIPQEDLRAGDLVFFKTGFKVRHVGMYLENGRFLHASTSRGVMISSLLNPYWEDAYWHSRRVGNQ